MQSDEQRFERSLEQAWRYVYDAMVLGEQQSRWHTYSRLRRASAIIAECQSDLSATRKVYDGEHARRLQLVDRTRQEQLLD